MYNSLNFEPMKMNQHILIALVSLFALGATSFKSKKEMPIPKVEVEIILPFS